MVTRVQQLDEVNVNDDFKVKITDVVTQRCRSVFDPVDEVLDDDP